MDIHYSLWRFAIFPKHWLLCMLVQLLSLYCIRSYNSVGCIFSILSITMHWISTTFINKTRYIYDVRLIHVTAHMQRFHFECHALHILKCLHLDKQLWFFFKSWVFSFFYEASFEIFFRVSGMTVEFYQTKEMPFPSAERFHVVKCDKVLNHLLKYISMTNLHRKSSNRFDLFYRDKFYTQEGISYFNGVFFGGGGLIFAQMFRLLQ